MISSPVCTLHYSQNIQIFLTGRFKIVYLVFKGELCVKNQAKEFGFFYCLSRFLSQKDVWVQEKNILLVKVDAHHL